MNLIESFKMALSSIWNHKMRSILTMLGIIIGVGAVIIIVAIGEGTQNKLKDELFSTDKNVIDLYYNGMEDESGTFVGSETFYEEPELTELDLDFLKTLPGVKEVIGTNDGFGTLVYNDKQQEMGITGVDDNYFSALNIKMVDGRSFTESDAGSMSRIVMIDTVAKKKLFKDADQVIGEIVDINDNPYRIVGVYKSPIPESFQFDDGGEILMPRTLVSMMFDGEEIAKVQIVADDPEMIAETGELAARKLTEYKKLEEGQYETFDMSEIEEGMNTFFTLMTLFIGSIAGISLLVGGIGVMNIMFVSVTERTREIGLRKALGATRGKILLQFLIESITLTSIGGLIGILFAAFVAFLISVLSPVQASISLLVVMIGVTFSALIGIVFGIIPANKASKLHPIDALRYE